MGSRRAVLDAAARRFGEVGYSGSSIAEIGSLAGMSKAAVLYHFPSKDALLVEILEPIIEAVGALADRWSEPATQDTQVELLRELMEVLIAHPAAARVTQSDPTVWQHDALRGRMEDNQDRLIATLAGASTAPDASARASVALGVVFRTTILGLDHRMSSITDVDGPDAEVTLEICRDILPS